MCRLPDLRDNNSPDASLYGVRGLLDTIALKRLCTVCHLHYTIALKRLCAVCKIDVIIIPMKPLCTVRQVYVTQLP